MRNMPSHNYHVMCRLMAAQLFFWKLSNPNANLILQWNIPPGIGVISTMHDALTHKFVSANADGLRMLNELGWSEDTQHCPTVIQVRAVIDHVYGRADEAKQTD